MTVLLSLLLPSCASKGTFIPSGPGPEDLVAAEWQGKPAIFTGVVKRLLSGSCPNGAIQVYRPGVDSSFHTIFQGSAGTLPLSPSGISYVACSRDRKWHGKSLLYVANQASGSVEVFSIGEEIEYLGTLKDIGSGKKKGRPNGIHAFPDGTVYVSQMSMIPGFSSRPPIVGSRPGLAIQNNMVSRYRPPAGGGAGGKWAVQVSGLNGANGICGTPEGDRLFVCSYHSQKLWQFRRDPATGDLDPSVPPRALDLRIPFKPDNLKYTPEGYQLCGQKYVLLSGLQLLLDSPISPGGWLSLKIEGDHVSAIDRGALLEGHRGSPSTAIIAGGRVYSGQPVSKGVFTRPLPPGS